VLLDGRSVKSCSVLAVQADGHQVTTSEGLAVDGELHRCRRAFPRPSTRCNAATAHPGMIMAAVSLLADEPDPTDREVREGIEGNLCLVHRLSEHRGRHPGRRRRDERRGVGARPGVRPVAEEVAA